MFCCVQSELKQKLKNVNLVIIHIFFVKIDFNQLH
jgi:hypothetical protein